MEDGVRREGKGRGIGEVKKMKGKRKYARRKRVWRGSEKEKWWTVEGKRRKGGRSNCGVEENRGREQQ